MSRYCLIGRHGFIGGALAARLGDVSSTPTLDTEVIIDMGSSVHPQFEENPDYYFKTLLDRHLYLLSFGKYYVYPSSALLYEPREIAFTHFKRAAEEIAKAYPNNLGLRIFPVYGPGETRTAPTQWCLDMLKGQRPLVYGDGTQQRDFIYIDDVVEAIISFIDARVTGVRDVGKGQPTPFNDIIDMINKLLATDLKPLFRPLPEQYSTGVVCEQPVPTRFSMQDGLTNILAHYRSGGEMPSLQT
jgi:nucleoside-diphosphate-sugar epimerase